MVDDDKPKKPRKPSKRRHEPPKPERLPDWRIDGMDEIFTGFADWYRKNHDEDGRFIGTMPGLKM